MKITTRAIKKVDLNVCSEIVYESFGAFSRRHNSSSDFPTLEFTKTLLGNLIDHPLIDGIVAEKNSRVIGCNFLDERDPIFRMGPLCVHQEFQGHGVGKKIMEKTLDQAKVSKGIRLLVDVANLNAISLYTSFGFQIKELMFLVEGEPKDIPNTKYDFAPLTMDSLKECSSLCQNILGYSRARELKDSITYFSPIIVKKDGVVTAYSSGISSWFVNHGVGETFEDIKNLILGMAFSAQKPISFLLASRHDELFHWCLKNGFRINKPLAFMSIGLYQEPKGYFFPSVSG